MLGGVAKFSNPRRKSYLSGEQTCIIIKELCARGQISVARLVAVCYTYQLRAQSRHRSDKSLASVWHSDVNLEPRQVMVKLHQRKESIRQYNVIRKCIRDVCLPLCVCGVFALRRPIKKMPSSSCKVFPSLKPTMINYFREIAAEHCLGLATWHGCRRGRNIGVVNALDATDNPGASLVELSDSGGWRIESTSIFRYMPAKHAVKQRCAKAVLDT